MVARVWFPPHATGRRLALSVFVQNVSTRDATTRGLDRIPTPDLFFVEQFGGSDLHVAQQRQQYFAATHAGIDSKRDTCCGSFAIDAGHVTAANDYSQKWDECGSHDVSHSAAIPAAQLRQC